MSDNLGISVTLDAELARFEQNMQRAGRLVETSTTDMDRATQRAARSFSQLEGRLDPVARAANRLERDQRRVQTALDRGAVSTERVARLQRLLNDQYEQTMARLQGVSSGVTTATGRMNAATRATQAAAGGTGRMGLAAQNAAFQVGDFAVQVASGTSATRALAQQLPQLLGGFGVIGAVIGAAVAVGGALVPVLFDIGEETKAADGATRTYGDSLEAVNEITDRLAKASKSRAENLRDEANAALEGARAEMVAAEARLQAAQAGAGVSWLSELLQDTLGLENRSTEALNPRDARAREALLERLGDAAEEASEKFAELRAELDAALAGDSAREGAQAAAQAIERAQDAILSLRRETGVLTGDLTENQVKVIELREALQEANVPLEEAQRLTEAYSAALEKNARASEAQKAAQEAANQALRDQQEAQREAERALQQYERAVEQTVGRIADRTEEFLGDALYDTLRGQHTDFLEFFETTFLRTIADVAAAAIRQQIVVPIVTRAVGSAPSAFGLGQPPNGASLPNLPAGDLFGNLFGGNGGGGGFLSTPIFGGAAPSNPIMDFAGLPGVGPQGVAGGTTIGGLLGGAGAGFAAGSLLNSLVGGNQIGGSVGSGVGGLAGAAIGSVVPGVGTLLGGLIGGAGGGLLGGMFGFGPNPTVGPNSVAGVGFRNGSFFGLGGQADNGGDAAAAAQAARQLSQTLNGLIALTGATATGIRGDFRVGDFPKFGGQFLSVGNPATVAALEAIYGPSVADPMASGQRPQGAFFLGEETMTAAVQAGLLETEFEDLNDTFRTIIQVVTRTRMSLEEIEGAFGFGGVYDAVVAAERPLTQFQQAMRDLTDQFREGTQMAADLSLDPDAFARGLRTTFNRDVQDEILRLTDPLGFALAEFERDAKARVRAAIEIGGNLVEVERLIGLQREEVLRQAGGDITEAIERALSLDAVGGLSPLSPGEKLAEAQEEFDRLVQLGLQGDAEAAQAAIRQRDILLEATDAVHGSTGAFADVFESSEGALRQLQAAFDAATLAGETTEQFVNRVVDEVRASGVRQLEVPRPRPLPEAPSGGGGGDSAPEGPDFERLVAAARGGQYRSVGEVPNFNDLPVDQQFEIRQGIQRGQGRALGGPVFGPGGPMDDRVPIMASHGEFVVRAAAAERVGMATLMQINRTGQLPGDGGESAGAVRDLTASAVPLLAGIGRAVEGLDGQVRLLTEIAGRQARDIRELRQEMAS